MDSIEAPPTLQARQHRLCRQVENLRPTAHSNPEVNRMLKW